MAQFEVTGVDRQTSLDTKLVIHAESPENARIKAELRGVIVGRLVEVDRTDVNLKASERPASRSSGAMSSKIIYGGIAVAMGVVVVATVAVIQKPSSVHPSSTPMRARVMDAPPTEPLPRKENARILNERRFTDLQSRAPDSLTATEKATSAIEDPSIVDFGDDIDIPFRPFRETDDLVDFFGSIPSTETKKITDGFAEICRSYRLLRGSPVEPQYEKTSPRTAIAIFRISSCAKGQSSGGGRFAYAMVVGHLHIQAEPGAITQTEEYVGSRPTLRILVDSSPVGNGWKLRPFAPDRVARVSPFDSEKVYNEYLRYIARLWYFVLSAEDMRRICEGKQVQARLDRWPFELTEAQLISLRHFYDQGELESKSK